MGKTINWFSCTECGLYTSNFKIKVKWTFISTSLFICDIDILAVKTVSSLVELGLHLTIQEYLFGK